MKATAILFCLCITRLRGVAGFVTPTTRTQCRHDLNAKANCDRLMPLYSQPPMPPDFERPDPRILIAAKSGKAMLNVI